ncbi:hypothetical protein ABZP36_001428 [Zizania latifolia]
MATFSGHHLYSNLPTPPPPAVDSLGCRLALPPPPSSLLQPLHCSQEPQAVASSYRPLSSTTASVPVDKGLLDDMVPRAMRHG